MSSETTGSKLSLKFLVSNSFAGSLIGTGGSAIRELMEVSEARISVSGPGDMFPGTSERIVLINGFESSVCFANSLMWELMAIHSKATDQRGRTATWSPRACASAMNMNDDVEVTGKVSIPAGAGGLILGRGGDNIRNMAEESGARIQMTSKEEAMFTQERILTISGSVQECRKCCEMVISKLAESEDASQYVNRGTSYSAAMSGLIGGPSNSSRGHRNGSGGRGGSARGGGGGGGGARAPDSARERAGPGDRDRDRDRDRGDRDGREDGAPIAATTTITLAVPDNIVGNIIGKQGTTLREIMSLSGAKISVSARQESGEGNENRIVTITGTPACAQTAHLFCAQKLQQPSWSRRGGGGDRDSHKITA